MLQTLAPNTSEEQFSDKFGKPGRLGLVEWIVVDVGGGKCLPFPVDAASK